MEKPCAPDPTPIQVFELTMDNDEDQDELNRRLRKPGEPASSPPTMEELKAPDTPQVAKPA